MVKLAKNCPQKKGKHIRRCIREEYTVHHANGQTQDEWIFYYDDGTEESILGPWNLQVLTESENSSKGSRI